jgi:ABC-type nitrate/sulfonate/bicarbonate transport system substrate-binding protein
MDMKKKRTFKRIIAAALLCAAVLLSACGKSENGDAALPTTGGESQRAAADNTPAQTVEETKNVTVKVTEFGKVNTTVDAPTLGFKKGFFAEEGIDIEYAGAIPVPQLVSALLSGTIDAGQLMVPEAIAAIANGAGLIQVGSSQSTTEDNPHMSYVVLKGSSIKRGRDLVGKKIGISTLAGGCMTSYPLVWAKQDGVENPLAEIEEIASTEETLVESLKKGEFDVVGLHLTPENVAKLFPEVDILFTDYDVLGENGGDVGWYFRREYVEQNPETVKKFLRAVAKTNNYINANPAEAAEFFKGIANVAINEKLFYVQHFAEDGIAEPEHTQAWIDILSTDDQAVELLQLKNPVTLEDVLDNQYNSYYTN